MRSLGTLRKFAGAMVAIAPLVGCGVGIEPLMPTPILYTECGFKALEHIPEAERTTPRRVYFATTRVRSINAQEITYTNDPADDIGVGLALVDFGGPDMDWANLTNASQQAERPGTIDLAIAGILEAGRIPVEARPNEDVVDDDARWLLADLNRTIDDARDKDVLVYVHGAKVNFYNACAFAAQLDHFMGRDLTPMAFSWPTRQDIFSYVWGEDRQRAYDSAPALAKLLEVLADDTNARRIHVLCWSAGARVTSEALKVLRSRHPEEREEDLRERFRIGTVYFAAADVPTSEFLEALPTIHGITHRVVVTSSSDDEALIMAKKTMGGGARLGQSAEDLTEDELQMIASLERLEVIDVSLGRDDRGFDITGHRYWFNHAWSSSDVVLTIRTDLNPRERGLEQGDHPRLWFMPPDYPQRLKESLRGRELRRW